MVSVPDIPLSMLIPLLPNQKKWNYIPLILNIYLFFTSHPPSTSITLGVSSYQVHGSHIRLWRGSSSYNQGYGRVSCALESNRKAVFVGDFSSALPWGQPTSVFHGFFPKNAICGRGETTTSATSTMTDPSATGFRKPWSWWRDAGHATGGPMGAFRSFDCEVVQDWYKVPVMFANVDPINSFDIIYIYIYNIPDIPSVF